MDGTLRIQLLIEPYSAAIAYVPKGPSQSETAERASVLWIWSSCANLPFPDDLEIASHTDERTAAPSQPGNVVRSC